MNSELLQKIEKNYINTKLPEVEVGDTVEVSSVIREGDKQRIQKFKGLVIAMSGSGSRKTITVRKISYGVGVEKIYAIHSPNVEDVKIVKHGKVRRSKLYYMRDRIGKMAMKVKKGRPVVEVEGTVQEVTEADVELQPEEEPAKEVQTVEE